MTFKRRTQWLVDSFILSKKIPGALVDLSTWKRDGRATDKQRFLGRRRENSKSDALLIEGQRATFKGKLFGYVFRREEMLLFNKKKAITSLFICIILIKKFSLHKNVLCDNRWRFLKVLPRVYRNQIFFSPKVLHSSKYFKLF